MTLGASLPEFDLETSAGSRITNNDLRGGRTVLYFYPKDDTPGCTLEGQEFTRLASAFADAGVTVYGISPDTLKKHQRFIDKCGLGIPLISDPHRLLIESQGLWVEKKFMGRTYMGVARTTLLIGPDGAIEREWRDVKPSGHAAEVLESVNGR
ncbi:MAG TPA: peroxiredoxin [Candidatus Dormibacteraeota bacterium]